MHWLDKRGRRVFLAFYAQVPVVPDASARYYSPKLSDFEGYGRERRPGCSTAHANVHVFVLC